jgi:hypothetical protein
VDALITIVAAAAAFAGTFAAGRWYGATCRKAPPARYWTANAVAMGIGLAVAVLGASLAEQWVWVTALGIMAGSVTGLKWGLGHVVGQASASGHHDLDLDEDDED